MYGTINALVILVGGLSSALIAGHICDTYESENLKIKSHVATVMSLLAVPLLAIVFLTHFNFYFAMFVLFLENLLAEGWMAPCIAMIQSTIDIKYKAVSVGVFFFGTAVAQALSAVVVGQLITHMNITDMNVTKLGVIITLNTSLPCLLAAFCFYKSGKPYEEIRLTMERQKVEAV